MYLLGEGGTERTCILYVWDMGGGGKPDLSTFLPRQEGVDITKRNFSWGLGIRRC